MRTNLLIWLNRTAALLPSLDLHVHGKVPLAGTGRMHSLRTCFLVWDQALAQRRLTGITGSRASLRFGVRRLEE